jgi:hypothetical protein
MSRLDPLRERQEFIEAMEAQRELSSPGELEQPARDRDPARPERPQQQPSRAPELPRCDVSLEHSYELIYDREHAGRLRGSEIRMLTDVGKFRVVAAADLAHLAYDGRNQQAQQDLQNLLHQGLIGKGSFADPEQTSRELLTLTKRGHDLLRANHLVPKNQAIYHGFVRPRNANHDADLYKLYNKGLLHVAKEGGRNPRVVLDVELSRKINQDIAKLGRDARPEIARHHGLRVVRDRIPIPDVRIEYEQPDGQMARLDLELVTEHYGRRSRADKVNAGFSLYTPHGEADRLRRVLDGQELTAEIFSL